MTQFWIFTIILFLCGALSASEFLSSKVAAAKPALAKVEPHQPWIGAVALLWGLWNLVYMLLNIGSLFGPMPIMSLLLLAATLCLVALGFLLAFPLLQQFVFSKNAEAAAKGELAKAALLGYREKLGLVAMAVAALLVLDLFYHRFLWKPTIQVVIG